MFVCALLSAVDVINSARNEPVDRLEALAYRARGVGVQRGADIDQEVPPEGRVVGVVEREADVSLLRIVRQLDEVARADVAVLELEGVELIGPELKPEVIRGLAQVRRLVDAALVVRARGAAPPGVELGDVGDPAFDA